MENLKGTEHILLAIDALDEAGTFARESLVRQLAKLAKLPMRIFLTSRPDVDITGLTQKTLAVRVTASETDLRSYAYKHLCENSNVLDMLDENKEALIPDITDLIVSQASGMYAINT